jgi:hypothetical protein
MSLSFPLPCSCTVRTNFCALATEVTQPLHFVPLMNAYCYIFCRTIPEPKELLRWHTPDR